MGTRTVLKWKPKVASVAVAAAVVVVMVLVVVVVVVVVVDNTKRPMIHPLRPS